MNRKDVLVTRPNLFVLQAKARELFSRKAARGLKIDQRCRDIAVNKNVAGTNDCRLSDLQSFCKLPVFASIEHYLTWREQQLTLVRRKWQLGSLKMKQGMSI